MRSREVRDLSTDEIRTKIDETRQALRNFRFQRATGQLTNLSRLRATKRDIARLETILRERELAQGQAEPDKEK